MIGSKRLYKICYCITVPFVSLKYRIKTFGREKISNGVAIVCGNHSSNIDPVLMAYAFTRKTHIHFMAKAELFKIPLLGRILKAIGTFPVDRGQSDVNAIKTAMKFLKDGEKVAMFPEGTRIQDESNTEAKTGAVILAVRTNVPVVPVYIARDKKKAGRIPVVIGEPYYIELDKKTAKHEDYKKETIRLMEKINGLRAVAK